MTPEIIEDVIDWAARYSTCTVAVGTKIKPTALEQITGLWPAVADPHLDPQAADSLWPRTTWDWLQALPDRFATHPVLQTNSCALAYVLGRADRAGVLNTPTCLSANRCPTGQRERCRQAAPQQRPVTEADIDAHLAKLGHPGLPHTLNSRTRTVVLGEPVPLRDRHNLAQALAVTVRSPQHPTERYWPGRLSGAQPLIIDSRP